MADSGFPPAHDPSRPTAPDAPPGGADRPLNSVLASTEPPAPLPGRSGASPNSSPKTETVPLGVQRTGAERIGSVELPRVPGYDVLGVLGRGAMGVVYQARHLALRRLVALKMIRGGAGAGPQELARFRTEAE